MLFVVGLVISHMSLSQQPVSKLPAFNLAESQTVSMQKGSVLADSLSGVGLPAFAINSRSYLDLQLQGYNNAAADDVVVPACMSWSLHSIEVVGKYSDPLQIGQAGPAVNVSVYIFTDLPGEPDTIDYSGALYAYEGLNYTDVDLGDFQIQLPEGAILPGGSNGTTYWISVRANLAVLVGGRWNWTESTIDLGSNVSQWQQSESGPINSINCLSGKT